jgi:hypothetical protein
MTFTALIKSPPLCLNQDDAIDYLGNRKLFNEMLAAKWIAPCVKRPKMHLFDRLSIDKAWARVRAGEYPGNRS